MRTTITLWLFALLLTGCNSVKRNQKMLLQGDYDQVIELAVKKLQKDPHGKNSASHKVFLEEAFSRVVAEDKQRIQFLKQETVLPIPAKFIILIAIWADVKNWFVHCYR